MIRLSLTPTQSTRLVGYIKDQSTKLHYGGGEITTPVQEMLISTIQKSGGQLELSVRQFVLLSEYIFEGTKEGVGLLPGDQQLIQKLYDALIAHLEEVRQANGLDEIERMVEIYEVAFLHKSSNTTEVADERTEDDVSKKPNLDEKIARASERIKSGQVGSNITIRSKTTDEKELLKKIIRKTKGRGLF